MNQLDGEHPVEHTQTRFLTGNFPRHTAFYQKMSVLLGEQEEELDKAMGDVPAFAMASVKE